MTYRSKIDAALAVINSHNESVEDSADQINSDEFLSRLKKMGGTSERALANSKYEDLENCGLPRILAREICETIFRTESEEKPEKIVIIDDDPVKEAARLGAEETLVAKLDLNEPDSPYAERADKLASGRKFIILNDNGELDVELTTKELQRLRKGYSQRDEVSVVNGDEYFIFKTYRVGDRPDSLVDEHPQFPGTPLNPDGTSDKGVEWGGLPLGVRQLLYIAITDTGELNSDSYEEIDLFDIVEGKTLDKVGRRYPKATVRFKELQKLGELPKLRVKLGGQDKVNNPFGINRTT
jgi:hypothetical protein